MNPLKHELQGALRDAHATALAELGFGMPALLSMIAQQGPTGAARSILPRMTDVYTKLWERNRLDLAVEAIVLRTQFRPLFTESELRLASQRLRESNYPVPVEEADASTD